MTTPLVFLKQTQEELKKVMWPSRQEIIRLTGVVLVISVAVGLYTGGLDFVFTKLLSLLIK